MPTYKVKPGRRHGVGKQYGPGDLVKLTEEEAAGLLDKLELVSDTSSDAVIPEVAVEIPTPNAVTVDEIRQWLEVSEPTPATLASLLRAEREGKKRQTVITLLEDRLKED